MADNIQEFDMHQARRMGWHGKTQVREDLTLRDCFIAQHDIIGRPLFFEDGAPAIAGSDENGNAVSWTVMGYDDAPGLTVGAPYNPLTFKPFTNAELLDIVEASLKGTSHVLESVLTCGNRSKIALSINLAQLESFKAAGREFQPYLNFLLGRDKGTPLIVKTGNVCVVCQNTYNMALREDGKLVNARVKQTKNSRSEISNLLEIIDAAVGVQAEFKAAMDSFAAVEVKHSEAKGIFLGHLCRVTEADIVQPDFEIPTRTLNRVDRLTDLFHDDSKGNHGRTLADVASAATDFFTHESAGGEDTWKQIASSEFGSADNARVEFVEMLGNPEALSATRSIGEKLLALC